MNRRGSYWLNLLKGIDYGLATLFGIPAGVYISSYVAFKRMEAKGGVWANVEAAINWLFSDPFHCVNSLKNNSEDIAYYYGVR